MILIDDPKTGIESDLSMINATLMVLEMQDTSIVLYHLTEGEAGMTDSY